MLHHTRGQPLAQLRQVKKEDAPERNINIWGWGPMKDQLITAPAGFERVETVIDACLMSQLYDFEIVLNAVGKPDMYARPEDIKQVQKCQVMLATSLDPIPSAESIYLISPLPLPSYGSYGLVSEGDSYHPYHLDQLPDTARQRWQSIREKIYALAALAQPDNVDHMWIEISNRHTAVANETTFQHYQTEIISKILGARDDKERTHFDAELAGLIKHRDQILMIDRLVQLPDFSELYQEIARMLQDLAQDYLTLHQTMAFMRQQDARKAPPVHLGITNGKLLLPTNQPFITAMEAIQNASSGADRWQMGEKQPPYYTRQTEKNITTIEYGRESEQQVFEDRAILNLWKDVKGFTSSEEKVEGFSDRDGDMLLYKFSAIIKEGGKDAVWIHAKSFLEQRGVKPITKKEGAVTRRAGDRTEDLAAIERSIYRLSGLWINIEEVFPPRKKGGKRRVYRHKGRLFAVMETWTQDTLTTTGETSERIPIAWKIKAGDWLMEYLDAPRYVAYLCDQSLKYDPHNELWEKRLSRYFLFFLRINARHSNSALTRQVGELIQANSLSTNERNPQLTRERFEKAMDRLLADGQIDSWEYVPEKVTDLPAKKWLADWLKWQVIISVKSRRALS